ncbi:MAG TPA: hypothetical protein PK845_01420 [Petrotogaceae bacterium]|nr:hypothetical protein [Petrotogaceae bacterium]
MGRTFLKKIVNGIAFKISMLFTVIIISLLILTGFFTDKMIKKTIELTVVNRSGEISEKSSGMIDKAKFSEIIKLIENKEAALKIQDIISKVGENSDKSIQSIEKLSRLCKSSKPEP